MTGPARRVQRVYLLLTLLTTLAASLIWGVNTLFLLDAGLSNTDAFVANAFYTLGMVLFEIPTGVVADTRGRRFSFLLGTATLLASTLVYLAMWSIRAPVAGWAVASVLIGLGYTFFSGATEAWLVDALHATGYEGALESVFSRAQVVTGVAMLTGSLVGGVIAQATDLGMPYIVRSALLGVTLVVAWFAMAEIGFVPDRTARPGRAVRRVLTGAIDAGWRNPPIRWLMVAQPFVAGTGVYVFYALQPFLLQLSGDPDAYAIAGLAAALVAGAQIVGGALAPRVGVLLRRRTHALLVEGAVGALLLVGVAFTTSLPVAVALVAGWAMVSAVAAPLRRSYIHALIPSSERATVVSFDSLMGSAGGVVIQPALGRVADVSGYPMSYLASAALQAMSVPFVLLARARRASSDPVATPSAGSA